MIVISDSTPLISLMKAGQLDVLKSLYRGILLIDEKAGRRVARTMGLHIQGTIGVLLQAYDRHLLTAKEIDEAIDKLRNSKRHISEEMFLYTKKYIEKG